MKRTIQIYILILFSLITIVTSGQEAVGNWDTPRLTGKRYTNQHIYKGPQYLNTEWSNGTVYLTNGDSAVNVFLKYNRYLDELIYYNKPNSSMVRLDKKPISGFTIKVDNKTYHFRKLVIGRILNKAGYYEILYSGRTELLASRRSELSICSSYYNESGTKMNLEFEPADGYFISDKDKGYLSIRLMKKSLLLKFGQTKKNEIRRILHKNNLKVTDENALIKTWKFLEESGYKPVF